MMNVVTVGEGERWRPRVPWHKGDHADPPWALLARINRVRPDDMLAVQTRNACRSIPAARTASARLMPSSAFAMASIRRATRFFFSRAARVRSPDAVRSSLISSPRPIPAS